jgi:hypothetical protein
MTPAQSSTSRPNAGNVLTALSDRRDQFLWRRANQVTLRPRPPCGKWPRTQANNSNSTALCVDGVFQLSAAESNDPQDTDHRYDFWLTVESSSMATS